MNSYNHRNKNAKNVADLQNAELFFMNLTHLVGTLEISRNCSRVVEFIENYI